MKLNQMKFSDVTEKFSLETNTLDFLGHAVALYTDNSYIDRPAIEVIKKI
jgi:Rab GDP dissociation inhibitor